MRIADDCNQCLAGKAKVYATIKGTEYVTRYRRCSSCGETSKTIAKIFLSSKQPVGIDSDIATIESSISINHSTQE